MVDTLEFHEFKFKLFKYQQESAGGTDGFIAEMNRRATYNPSVQNVAKDAEKLRGMDYENTRNFIITIVVNLDYGRREAKMSSWYASLGAANYDRQLKIERCVMEFYDFCVKQGLEPLCHEIGFNLSQTPLSEVQVAYLTIQKDVHDRAVIARGNAVANANPKEKDEKEPLRIAVLTDNIETIETFDANAVDFVDFAPFLELAKTNNKPKAVALLTKLLAKEREQIARYASKLERRGALAEMRSKLGGGGCCLCYCGFFPALFLVFGMIPVDQNDADWFGMITNITNSIGAIGVLMMIVGAVGSIIYSLFTPFISTLNDELRPVFGQKMEAFAAVRCAACHKLGYVMPVDSKPSKCLNCGYEF